MNFTLSSRAAFGTTVAAIIASACAPASAQSLQTNLSPILVTAARSPQSAKDVLADTLTISAEEIAASGQRNLTDLLQQKRGFEMSRSGGPGSATSMFIRGAANNQSIVLVDGLRIGSATLGGATWENIPLSQIDHIEIVYGPLSSLYGADAMGGVVQIFTRQGEGAPHGNVEVGVGSYGTASIQAGIAGATAGSQSFRYALQGAHEKSEGFSASKPGAGAFTFNPDNDGYNKSSASAQFGVAIAPGHDLALQLLNSRLHAQFDAGAGFDDRLDEELGTYALVARDQWSSDWRTALTIGQSNDKNRTFASYGNGFINTKQNQYSLQSDLNIGTDTLQLVAERRVESVDSDTTALVRDRTTDSIAASYRLRRDAHLASIAVRSDDSSQFGDHVTGNLDYGYRFNADWRFNAGAGTSFRAPTFNELYYPGYGIATNKPEKGRNIEAGIYYDHGTTQLSAVAYQNRLTDLLVYAPVCPVQVATHAFGCAYNIDRATLAGVTMAYAQGFGHFTARASVDLQDPQDDTTGKRLARRAKQHGSIGLDYAVDGLTAGIESVLSGERFDDAGNLNRLDGYGLLNVYASQVVGRDWTVFGRWNNLTGKNYELVRNYATAGSNLFVGVRYAMK
jgi:vitamin B12 transporter